MGTGIFDVWVRSALLLRPHVRTPASNRALALAFRLGLSLDILGGGLRNHLHRRALAGAGRSSTHPHRGRLTMSEAALFIYANTFALACRIVLMLQPKRTAPLLRLVVPSLLAVLYIWALATTPPNPDGGFGSLAAVKSLFSEDRAVLAGWVHYLAFDLFVGCWIVTDAAERGIAHLATVPCLVLTFMFGPAGLLLYFGLRWVSGRIGDAAVTGT